jgi:hypothetical protein
VTWRPTIGAIHRRTLCLSRQLRGLRGSWALTRKGSGRLTDVGGGTAPRTSAQLRPPLQRVAHFDNVDNQIRMVIPPGKVACPNCSQVMRHTKLHRHLIEFCTKRTAQGDIEQTALRAETQTCSKCNRKVKQRDFYTHERVCAGIRYRRKSDRPSSVMLLSRKHWPLFSKKTKEKLPIENSAKGKNVLPPKPAPNKSERVAIPTPATTPTTVPAEMRCTLCGRQVKRDLMQLHLRSYCPRHPDALPLDIGAPLIHLAFELLPAGSWKISDVVEYYKRHDTHQWLGGREVDLQRIINLTKLKPIRCSVGKSEWLGYILFEFQWSTSVVLECPITGNAVYILSGDWRSMVGESKGRLLTEFRQDTTKVVHKGDWLMRVRQALESNLGNSCYSG